MLAPGEGIAVVDPLGMVLHRAAVPHVVQMWKPLHREVAVVDSRIPDGTPLRLLTGVLVPSADAPKGRNATVLPSRAQPDSFPDQSYPDQGIGQGLRSQARRLHEGPYLDRGPLAVMTTADKD